MRHKPVPRSAKILILAGRHHNMEWPNACCAGRIAPLPDSGRATFSSETTAALAPGLRAPRADRATPAVRARWRCHRNGRPRATWTRPDRLSDALVAVIWIHARPPCGSRSPQAPSNIGRRWLRATHPASKWSRRLRHRSDSVDAMNSAGSARGRPSSAAAGRTSLYPTQQHVEIGLEPDRNARARINARVCD